MPQWLCVYHHQGAPQANQSQDFYVFGLASSGSVPYTVTAPGLSLALVP